MNREQITRDDFPPSEDGYDRPSVIAHLEAVAALTGALEAQIKALEVERDALRRQSEEAPRSRLEAPVASTEPEPSAPTEDGEATVEAEEPGTVEPEPTGPEPSAHAKDRSDDEVSARLVATRLALEGSERDEIVARLVDTYEIDDADALVGDVLERIA